MAQVDDDHWMRRALALAARGRGFVEPNPMVGAVLVRDGKLVGEGFHAKFGNAHAEIVAIQAAGDQSQNADLYVTLEPCCHHGKTPPCVDTIIRAGIRRVIVAMADPFPKVSGQGIAQLASAGVAIQVGLCEAESRRLNQPYLTLIELGRPYIHLKWAMSLDGKLATSSGDSKWISNEASRRLVHELRGRMDAIIVGAGTVRTDDPQLTARPAGPRTPARIVLSSKPTLPAGCQILRSAAEAPVILASKEPGSIPGVEVVVATSITVLASELGRRRMTNVLVEGGAKVLGSFFDAGLVDEIHVFVAPKIIGGTNAPSPLGGIGVNHVADALQLSHCEIRFIDNDIYIHGIKEPRPKLAAIINPLTSWTAL